MNDKFCNRPPDAETSDLKEKNKNDSSVTYSTKVKMGNHKNNDKKLDPNWSKVFLDWKDKDNLPLKGFVPDMKHYEIIFSKLNVSENEIMRINDCKSNAGHIVLTFKRTINVVTKFETITGPEEVDEGIFFNIRGLQNMRKSLVPTQVIVKNGSEVDAHGLRDILTEFGEIIGDMEDVPHSIFKNVKSGKLKLIIKPRKRIPSFIPVRGKKVELISSAQHLQCFGCLKLGHVKKMCRATDRMNYKQFEEYFRTQFGIPNKVVGEEERAKIEEVARLEDLDEAEEGWKENNTKEDREPCKELGKESDSGGATIKDNVMETLTEEMEPKMPAKLKEEWQEIFKKKTKLDKNPKRAFGSPEDDSKKRSRGDFGEKKDIEKVQHEREKSCRTIEKNEYDKDKGDGKK